MNIEKNPYTFVNPQQNDKPKDDRPFYQKKRYMFPAGILTLGVIGWSIQSIGSESASPEPSPTSQAPVSPTEEVPEPAEEPSPADVPEPSPAPEPETTQVPAPAPEEPSYTADESLFYWALEDQWLATDPTSQDNICFLWAVNPQEAIAIFETDPIPYYSRDVLIDFFEDACDIRILA